MEPGIMYFAWQLYPPVTLKPVSLVPTFLSGGAASNPPSWKSLKSAL